MKAPGYVVFEHGPYTGSHGRYVGRWDVVPEFVAREPDRFTVFALEEVAAPDLVKDVDGPGSIPRPTYRVVEDTDG